MKRFVPGLMSIATLLGLVLPCAAKPPRATNTPAAVSGVISDAHGAPQLGAMVELLAADATTIAVAFSDEHGRYILPSVLPGKYQLRASAAFFMPTLRSNLRLQPGVQSIVNLTMNTIFDADNWLPAQRRRADEPVDDWKWALRSTANRPLLRLVDPEDGLSISSSSETASKPISEGRVTVTNGDGTFGDGGMHQALLLSRTMGDGDGAVLRADIGNNTQSVDSPGPSVAVTAGYERQSMLGGSTRLVTGFQSHPELANGSMPGFGPGFEVLDLASAQKLQFGDAVMIDVGTLIEAERLEATRIHTQPYVHVTARPTDNVVVEYRYATSRQVQSADDLDRLKPELTAVSDAQGRPLGNQGTHNELAVSRRLGQDVVTVSGYIDHLNYEAVGGSGMMVRSDLQQTGIVADPTTGTFQVATQGFAARGVSATWMHPLTPALSTWVKYDLGTAMTASGDAPPVQDLQQNLTAQTASAASVAIRGKVLHTGTSVKAEYRWQPNRTLTQVNAYNNMPDEAYLSFFLRQRLWCGRFLPQGIDAVVEATNLLEQGYQPFLAPDGHTLFLAQIPRGIQGGLAFNF
ncbi:hypothetical protein GOB94_01630 [Granulicella sp. 5B5]|uniref:carboxypeptidase-like regulatory domain-containing protein n=1 Tax=Granulicella sp. 5B5 TaxID=1617967 RepID=UPI0015F3AABD|nr:carboxypeptidase-like regulatory domain-containing protein [Granulicella sp. 5B5]QMV17546.1 hypothetical protein GOB94_01630 [Granulicella sp. 5B5]